MESSQDAEILALFIQKNPVVRFVRLCWLDLTSTLRTRVLTLQHLRALEEKNDFHGLGRLYMTSIGNEAPLSKEDPSAAVGQNCLVPDFESLRLCPWIEGHATVFCYFSERRSHNQLTEGRRAIVETRPLCPREALRRVLKKAQALGCKLLVGFEIEFVCFSAALEHHSDQADKDPHQASGSRTTEPMLPVLCRIADVLSESGIDVQHFHAEAGSDQYEVVTGPMEPMRAADALVHTREVIHTICKNHSMKVSFHPCYPAENGTHLNLSILRPDLSADNEMGECFLAGVLEHLSALFALGLPHPESYNRIKAGHQTTGIYKAWGTQNRETPIRRKDTSFWEFRFMDMSSNVYLFLAGLLGAGLSGIESSSELLLLDCTGKYVRPCLQHVYSDNQITVDPAMATDNELGRLGIEERIPTTTSVTFEALKDDDIISEVLGSVLLVTYCSLMKEYENMLEALGPQESKLRIDWLTKRI